VLAFTPQNIPFRCATTMKYAELGQHAQGKLFRVGSHLLGGLLRLMKLQSDTGISSPKGTALGANPYYQNARALRGALMKGLAWHLVEQPCLSVLWIITCPLAHRGWHHAAKPYLSTGEQHLLSLFIAGRCIPIIVCWMRTQDQSRAFSAFARASQAAATLGGREVSTPVAACRCASDFLSRSDTNMFSV